MGTGFKIWFITAFLNAFYFSVASVLQGRFLDIFWSIVIFFVGCILLLPLMIVFMELLKSGRSMPYTLNARIALLTFWASGFIALLCALLNMTLNDRFGLERSTATLTGTTIAAWITAILLCRQSLQKVALPPAPPPPMPRNFQGSIEDLPSAKIRIR
jgi:hypothetical protein